MRIANVENDALNWMSFSSGGALDMTHCDFSRRPARDEMRHIIGSSEPDVIIGSDRGRNRECRKKDRDHMDFLCELYEAQVARGRYFVHELTSEVNSRMKDERGPGFVNVSVRTVTNAKRVGVRPRLQSKCASTDRHARVDCDNPTEKGEQTGSWSVWEGWHWDDNKGGWLDPELCAKARREEVEYIRRHKMYTTISRETSLRETGWVETDKGQPGKPNARAKWDAKEYKTHARPELCASTPPLKALKIVLSEIGTGKR